MFHCVCVCVHTHAWRGGGSRGETNKVCVEMGGKGGGGDLKQVLIQAI